MTLVEYDEKLQRSLKNTEDHMFDRETRNSSLSNGEFSPPPGTLFEAIYEELKHKEERQKQSRQFPRMLSRLRENRAKEQFIGSSKNSKAPDHTPMTTVTSYRNHGGDQRKHKKRHNRYTFKLGACYWPMADFESHYVSPSIEVESTSGRADNSIAFWLAMQRIYHHES